PFVISIFWNLPDYSSRITSQTGGTLAESDRGFIGCSCFLIDDHAVRVSVEVCAFLLIGLITAAAAFAQTPPQPAPKMSLSTALSTAMQQVSTLRQAEIDEQIAAEDLRQAETAFLPRARDSFSITYNSRSPGTPDPSFIAQNAIHEYQNLLGVTGDLNFGLRAAVRRARALMEAARAGTEIARRALIRGVNEAYYGAALATAKRRTAEQSLLAAQEFERVTDLNFRAAEADIGLSRD